MYKTKEMEKIINQTNPKWEKDYIIRNLYVRLASFFERDLEYFLASDEQKFELYQKGFKNKGNIIVCSTLADFYVELFDLFHIKAKKIPANSAKVPLFAIVVQGTHGEYYLDPLGDLFHNQYGLLPTEFGVVPRYKTLNNAFPNLIRLPEKYLREIDTELKLYQNQMSLNQAFKLLHQEMTNRNVICKHFNLKYYELEKLFHQRIALTNDHLINIGNVRGPFERLSLYLFLENQLFFGYEKKNITIKIDKEFDANCSIEYNLKDKKTGETIWQAKYIDEKTENTYTLKRVI